VTELKKIEIVDQKSIGSDLSSEVKKNDETIEIVRKEKLIAGD